MSRNTRVAVVTGAGPGTGAAVVRRFARGGYEVAMLARNRERLNALAQAIPHSHAWPCDVTDQASLDAALHGIAAELGNPRVLVHKRWAELSAISWRLIPRSSTAIFRSMRWPCFTWRAT